MEFLDKMKRKKDFEDLNEEIFNFYNSNENRGIFSGISKELSIFDIQHLIYRHIREFNGSDKNAITPRLKKYLSNKGDL